MVVPFVYINNHKVELKNTRGFNLRTFTSPYKIASLKSFFESDWDRKTLRYSPLIFEKNEDFIKARLEMIKFAYYNISQMAGIIVYNLEPTAFTTFISPSGEKIDNFHFEVAYPHQLTQFTVSFQSGRMDILKIVPFCLVNGLKNLYRKPDGSVMKNFIDVCDINSMKEFFYSHW
jgi:hypothetical protein